MSDYVEIWEDVDGLELFLDDFVASGEQDWSVVSTADSERHTGTTTRFPSYKSTSSSSSSSSKTRKVVKAATKRSTKAAVPLVAFPAYDRHDSLIYFPNKMIKLLNCGDHDGLSKLLRDYTHRGCEFYFDGAYNHSWQLSRVLGLFATAADMHPDSLNCVHTTQVNANVIDTTIYFKFTDSLELNRFLLESVRDPSFRVMITRNRGDYLKQRLHLEEKTIEERERMDVLADSAEDLTIYGKTNFRLVFDDVTKKIVQFVFDATLTSIEQKLPVPDTEPF
jgi:hypothetical protein